MRKKAVGDLERNILQLFDIGKDYNKQLLLCMAVCSDITKEARYNLKP